MSDWHDLEDANAQAKLELFNKYGTSKEESDLEVLTAIRTRDRKKDIGRKKARRAIYEKEYAELLDIQIKPSITNPEKQIVGAIAASQKAFQSVLPVLQEAKTIHQQAFGKMLGKKEGGEFIMETLLKESSEDPSVKACFSAFQSELKNPVNATDQERQAYRRMLSKIRQSKVFTDSDDTKIDTSKNAKKTLKAKMLTALIFFFVVFLSYAPTVLAIARNSKSF